MNREAKSSAQPRSEHEAASNGNLRVDMRIVNVDKMLYEQWSALYVCTYSMPGPLTFSCFAHAADRHQDRRLAELEA